MPEPVNAASEPSFFTGLMVVLPLRFRTYTPRNSGSPSVSRLVACVSKATTFAFELKE